VIGVLAAMPKLLVEIELPGLLLLLLVLLLLLLLLLGLRHACSNTTGLDPGP